MPLARWTVYQGGPQIWVAPTADDSDGWLASMRHIAIESGAFVVSAPQYIPAAAFPDDFPVPLPEGKEVFGRGGAAIIEPSRGEVIAGPLYGEEGLLVADCDLRVGLRAKRWFDAVGHYSRADVLGRADVPARGRVEAGAGTSVRRSRTDLRTPLDRWGHTVAHLGVGAAGVSSAQDAVAFEGRSRIEGSDADNLDRGEASEVCVLGHDHGLVTYGGGRDPGVVSAQLAASAQLLVGDSGEARSGHVVDIEQRVFGANAGQGRHPRGPGRLVRRAQHAELELGRGDDGHGDFVGQLRERAPCLARDEDRGIGDGPSHRSSISTLRTSARSSSSPGSAPASSTIRSSVAAGTQGLRVAAWGTMSATGVRLTVSDRRSPERTAATTSAVWFRSSLTETSRAMEVL